MPRFNLKDPRSKEKTLIFLVYRYRTSADGQKYRLKYSTGKKVLPKFWMKDEAKESLHHPEHIELNVFLRNLKNEALRIASKEPLISPDRFKEKLDLYNGYISGFETDVPTLEQYVKEFLRNKDYEMRTVSKFLGVQNHLREYAKRIGKPVTFEMIDHMFAQEFKKYLFDQGVSSDNTLNKIFRVIKQLMKAAAAETILVGGEEVPYHTNTKYTSTNFGVKRIKTTKHWLNLQEINRLIELDLSEHPAKDLVRDAFIISCYTGLRISDLKRLEKKHLIQSSEGWTIRMHTFKGRKTKADNQIEVPIFPEVMKILKKHDFTLPPLLSEQKHNKHIKELCKSADIDRLVLHKSSIKGESVESYVPLYTKITNHTGRYTFITNMMNEYNISPVEMQKMTGQSLDVLMQYERGNKHKNAIKVLSKINS